MVEHLRCPYPEADVVTRLHRPHCPNCSLLPENTTQDPCSYQDILGRQIDKQRGTSIRAINQAIQKAYDENYYVQQHNLTYPLERDLQNDHFTNPAFHCHLNHRPTWTYGQTEIPQLQDPSFAQTILKSGLANQEFSVR